VRAVHFPQGARAVISHNVRALIERPAPPTRDGRPGRRSA
jgi:hypothetical protein